MKAAPAAPVTATRQRLLAAASRVYARAGLTGATTRAIAAEAGVNEVTLFRHFKSKDRLLAAVVGENFGERPAAPRGPVPAPTADLRADLIALGKAYEELLTRQLAARPCHARRDAPSSQRTARETGLPRHFSCRSRRRLSPASSPPKRRARSGATSARTSWPTCCSAAFSTGVLRRSLPHLKIDYTAATYLEAAVALFLTGAAVTPGRK